MVYHGNGIPIQPYIGQYQLIRTKKIVLEDQNPDTQQPIRNVMHRGRYFEPARNLPLNKGLVEVKNS